MTVPVHFPNGDIRMVPGQLQRVDDPRAAGEICFRQIPLNCDPLWRYQETAGHWVAVRRFQPVENLRIPAECWWESIACMADAPPVAPAVKSAA